MKKSASQSNADFYANILRGTEFEKEPREGVYIPYSEDMSFLARPMKIGDHTAPNRIVYQPMEGQDADENGNPTEITFERYKALAHGGAGIIWVEAVSVLPEGRSNRHQLMITEENVSQYADLVRTIKEECEKTNGYTPLVFIQLNHSGRHSKPEGTPAPIVAHHIPKIEKMPLSEDRIADDAYLASLPDIFADRAKLSEKAGFDGVDIKCCHGYLYSELLSCTDRAGEYGGAFENRIKLLVDTLEKVDGVLSDKVLRVCRLNVYDGFRFSPCFATDEEDHEKYDLTESKKLVSIIENYIDLLNITVGSPYYNPDVSRPYRRGIDVSPTNALRAEERMFNAAREIHKAFPLLPCVNTGISGLCEKSPYAAAGMIEEDYTDFVGFGRMSFAYPDMARGILGGNFEDKKCCVACSGCSTLKKNGLLSGCIVRNERYRKIYREFLKNSEKA